MIKSESFLLGCAITLFLVVMAFGLYQAGYDNAIELCFSHPVECKVLYGKGDKQ